MEERGQCQKCQGKQRIIGTDGTIRPCWDCLMGGSMDQHDKNPKDSGIRI